MDMQYRQLPYSIIFQKNLRASRKQLVLSRSVTASNRSSLMASPIPNHFRATRITLHVDGK